MGPPPPTSPTSSASSSSRTFRIVSLLTLSLSLMGLCANLIHLGNYHHTTEVDHVSHLPPPLTTMVKDKRRASDETYPPSSVKREDNGKGAKKKEEEEAEEESGLNEEEVFKNVLQRSISILEWCNNNNNVGGAETLPSSSEKRATGNNNSDGAAAAVGVTSSSLSSSLSLDQFGIINGLTSHLSSSSSSLSDCHLPPSKSCHTQTLTVIISTSTNKGIASSNGTNGLRPTFLLCMKLLTYPFVTELILIYGWDKDTLKMDDKYGQRLLSWDEDLDHPFRLHLISNGENVSEVARMWSKYSPDMEPQNDALLYLNGDITASTFNRKGLQSGLELFRRNSGSVLGWGGYRIEQSSGGSLIGEMQRKEMELLIQMAREGGGAKRKEEDDRKRRMLLEDTAERTAKGGDTNTVSPTAMAQEQQQQQQQQQQQRQGSKTTNFIPACKNCGPLTYVRQTTAEAAPAIESTPPPPEEYQFYANIIPTSHGMILHRSYLCWLSHPMFENVRNYAAAAASSVVGASSSSVIGASSSVSAESVAVTMLVTQLSGLPIRTYPAKVGGDVVAIDDENDRVGADKKKTTMLRGKHNGGKTNEGRRRRLSMLLPAKGEQRQYQNSTSSHFYSPLIPIPSYERRVLKLNSNEQQRPRSLTQEKDQIKDKVDFINTTTSSSNTETKSDSTVTHPNDEEQRILTTIMQYFGNYHIGSLGWCLGSTKYERLHGTTRENICLVPNNKDDDKNADGIIEEVPWMTVGGLGYDSC